MALNGALDRLSYSPEAALRVCDALADGKSMEEAAAAAGWDRRKLYRMMLKYPKFGEAVRDARRMSAPVYEDKALAIADELSTAATIPPPVVTARAAAMQQYRWSAERRNPEEYQRKPDLNAGVQITINTPLDLGAGLGGSRPGQTAYEFAGTVIEAEQVLRNPTTGVQVPLTAKTRSLAIPSKNPPGKPLKPGHKDARITAITKGQRETAARKRAAAAEAPDVS